MARLSILETALWDVPRNEIIQAETPEIYKANLRHTISGFAVLIQDAQAGTILYDTGISADWAKEWPDQFKRDYTLHQLNSLEEKLSELNLSRDQIDLVICSHLHYDHAGNIRLFQNTKAGRKIMISEAEAHEAFVNVSIQPDGVCGAYFRNEFIMDGIGYQLISADTWLSKDVFLFLQKGHTPGVIGLLVKTDQNGAFLFPSDAVYSKLNFGPPVVLPGLCVDPGSYRENIERLRHMQSEFHAKIIYSHETDGLKSVPCSPAWIE